MLNAWILLYLAVFLFAIFVIWRRNQFDLFHPVPLFLAYLFIQIGASNVLYVDFDMPSELALPLPMYAGSYVEATWIAILATVLVTVGCLFAGSRSLPIGRESTITENRLRLAIPVMFMLGFLSLGVLFEMNGGMAEFMAGREAWRARGLIGQGFVIFPATTALNLIALLNLAYVYITNKTRARRIAALCIFASSLIPSLFLGFRSTILLPVLQAVLIVNYTGAQRLPFRRLVFLSTLVLGFFTLYGLSREMKVGSQLDLGAALELAAERPEFALIAISRSRGADVVANVITKLDATSEFDFGLGSLKELATIWVPGALWSGKPVSTGQRFTTYFFGATLSQTREDFHGYYGGISPTFVGETYWHSGYLGTIVISLLWGAIGQIMYSTLLAKIRRPSFLVFYSMFWAAFVMSAEFVQVYANTLLLGSMGLALILVTLNGRAAKAAAGGEPPARAYEPSS